MHYQIPTPNRQPVQGTTVQGTHPQPPPAADLTRRWYLQLWRDSLPAAPIAVQQGATIQATSLFPPNQPEVWLGFSDRYGRTLQPMPVPYLPTTPTRVTGALDWIQPLVDVIWTS